MKSDVPKIDTKNNYVQLRQKNSVAKGLSDNASIMQAELIAIHAALLHGLQYPSRCIVFSDS